MGEIKFGGVPEMVNKSLFDTLIIDSVVKCVNEKCNRISSGSELDETDGKCPYCGTQLAKPQFPPDETDLTS